MMMRFSLPLLLTLVPSLIAGCGNSDPLGRATAEHVLGLGGTVTLAGKTRELGQTTDLPQGSLEIERVSLNETTFSDDDLKRLADLRRLAALSLYRTAIGDENLDHLLALKTLTELELSYTNISDEGLEKLSALNNLEKLFVTGTNVTDEGIESFQKKRPQCQVIRLD